MKSAKLKELLRRYKSASSEYHATSYWDAYEKTILETIDSMDMNQLRSGKYPILATFGFNDVIHLYHPNLSWIKKSMLKFVHNFILKDRAILPYGLDIRNIQEMAYHHCELIAESTKSTNIENIEVSTFGNPQDVFKVSGRNYTMTFLSYYLRYCFVNKYIGLKGDETIVELGSGSGYQVEILKKIHPNLTILCFDLPAQLFLCEEYLSKAISQEVVGSNLTSEWNNLDNLKKGALHFFGNWQIPLLKNLKFDIFWNAASFGEMEPDVVKNYINQISGKASWIYLLQARNGKETSGKNHVKTPIDIEFYKSQLSSYSLIREQDAWLAHSKLAQSGGYFEGIWKQQ